MNDNEFGTWLKTARFLAVFAFLLGILLGAGAMLLGVWLV